MEISHDILLEILKYLPTSNFLNFSLVCFSWSKAVKDDFIWLHKLKTEEGIIDLREELKNYNSNNYKHLYKELTGFIWDEKHQNGCIIRKSKIFREVTNQIFPAALAKFVWKKGKHSWLFRATKEDPIDFDWFTIGVADRGIVKVQAPFNEGQSYPYNQQGQYCVSSYYQKCFVKHTSYMLEETDVWENRRNQFPFTFRCELDIEKLEFRMFSEEYQAQVFWTIIPPVEGYTPWITFDSSNCKAGIEILSTSDKEHHPHKQQELKNIFLSLQKN